MPLVSIGENWKNKIVRRLTDHRRRTRTGVLEMLFRWRENRRMTFTEIRGLKPSRISKTIQVLVAMVKSGKGSVSSLPHPQRLVAEEPEL